MTVAELRQKLSEFNQSAKFQVIVNCYPKPFKVAFGSSDGCTKETCDDVSLMIDCESERVR